jgi:hypothetical protein
VKLTFKWYKNDDLETNLAIQQYARLWQEHGKAIQSAFTNETGLKFTQYQITVRVHAGDKPSNSGTHRLPMSLNLEESRKGEDNRIEILTHELAHRLLSGHGLRVESDSESTETRRGHRRIYLFLYEVWEESFGKTKADTLAAIELDFINSHYLAAWDWARAKTHDERQKEIARLRTQSNEPSAVV